MNFWGNLLGGSTDSSELESEPPELLSEPIATVKGEENSEHHSERKANTQIGAILPMQQERQISEKDKMVALWEAYEKRAKESYFREYSCFENPVPFVSFPDYYKKIKHPICLSQIEKKVLTDAYTDFYSFLKDFKQIAINARIFNGPKAPICQGARKLEELFYSLLNTDEKRLYGPLPEDVPKNEEKTLRTILQLDDAGMVDVRKLELVLNSMKKLDKNNVFQDDPTPLLYNYRKYIKQPMCLGRVSEKLSRNEYSTNKQFYDDMMLIWNNCISYNGVHSPFSVMATKYRSKFETYYCKLFTNNTSAKRKESTKNNVSAGASPEMPSLMPAMTLVDTRVVIERNQQSQPSDSEDAASLSAQIAALDERNRTNSANSTSSNSSSSANKSSKLSVRHILFLALYVHHVFGGQVKNSQSVSAETVAEARSGKPAGLQLVDLESRITELAKKLGYKYKDKVDSVEISKNIGNQIGKLIALQQIEKQPSTTIHPDTPYYRLTELGLKRAQQLFNECSDLLLARNIIERSQEIKHINAEVSECPQEEQLLSNNCNHRNNRNQIDSIAPPLEEARMVASSATQPSEAEISERPQEEQLLSNNCHNRNNRNQMDSIVPPLEEAIGSSATQPSEESNELNPSAKRQKVVQQTLSDIISNTFKRKFEEFISSEQFKIVLTEEFSKFINS